MSPRSLYPRFKETVGKVSGVDWLFGLDEADPWVKTYVVIYRPRTIIRSGVYSPCPCSWRANSNVVRYQLRPVGKRGDRSGSLTVHRFFTRLMSSKSYQNGLTKRWSPRRISSSAARASKHDISFLVTFQSRSATNLLLGHPYPQRFLVFPPPSMPKNALVRFLH